MSGVEVGSIVRVRSRQYLVEEIIAAPRPGEDTCLRISCLDDDAQGQQEHVLWESELDAEVLSQTGWAAKAGLDEPRRFAAFLHTQRWNCVTSSDAKLLQAPWRAGIEVMPYQLEPLRKALLLPRVNLFIADDVGLGKTIEAGLIVRELLLRQRVRRVVVACPASVVWQWKNELEARFGLSFAVFDSAFVRKCRRERGYAVNPWKTHNAFVISHNALRDEEYAGPMRDWLEDKRPYPGSLLILDEAHNAAPASGSRYAIDSKLTSTVRELKDYFEHRLFLSATPHNGHSNSFSALLEMLDPQRFCRGVPVRAKDLDEVMVRRLKADLREVGAGKFPTREVLQLNVAGLPEDAPELRLPELLSRYREAREASLVNANKTQRAAGLLVCTSLQKRLLSSTEAFARTLRAHKEGLLKKHKAAAVKLDFLLTPPGADDEAAELSTEELEQLDDAQVSAATALGGAISASESALLDEMTAVAEAARDVPDAKLLKLIEWLKSQCFTDSAWNERRVIVFTEYADTLRVIRRQLEELLPDSESRIDVYQGGMAERREQLKEAFNEDPWKNRLRILICTDAAREGVNLQNYCADLFHYDVPWNPGRMEQRNGRIDRKHQRETTVRCHYFFYAQRPEDRVLQVLVEKSRTIAKELGSLSQVIDARLEKTLSRGIRREHVGELELEIRNVSAGDSASVVQAELEATRSADKLKKELAQLERMLGVSKEMLGFSAEGLRLALNESLAIIHAPLLSDEGVGPNGKEVWKVPDLLDVKSAGPGWLESLDTLRKPRKPGEKLWDWRRANPPRPVVFEDVGALDDEHVHLHLEQKLVQRLLGRFLAQGFVHDDLSRVCAIVSSQTVPKVILVARLSLHGAGAARLHDELVHVTAPWSKRPLKPYAEATEALTLEALDAELTREDVVAPSSDVKKQLLATLADDVSTLEGELKARAEAAERTARVALEERAKREAEALRQLISVQQERIRETLTGDAQGRMEFSEEEKRQAAAEAAHQKKRLEELKRELVEEPKRLAGSYAVRSSRVELLGVIYLWPRGA